MPRTTLLVSILAALLLLGACGPAGGGTAYGEDDVSQAVTDVTADLADLATSFQDDLGVDALAGFPGPLPGSMSAVTLNANGLSLASAYPSQATSLLRGIWEWDDGVSLDWVKVGDSSNLEMRWPFLDATATERNAKLVVDWGVTDQVRDGGGALVEVPTAMNVTMTVGTITVADVDAEFDWYSSAACAEGILEPDRVSVDGSFGVTATLVLDAITFEITPAAGANVQMAFSGETVASANGDRAGLDWTVTVMGPLARGTNCFTESFEPESGTVDVLLSSEQAGVTSSLGLSLSFENLDMSGPTGASVDLDGELSVDGAAAVSFSGTLNDKDGNGIPGDNLVLVFKNGDTTTLETFIESQLEATATTAIRVLSLFR